MSPVSPRRHKHSHRHKVYAGNAHRHKQGDLIPLVRKLRRTGTSLSLVIPSDFVDLLELKPGEEMQFYPEPGGFRVQKAKTAAKRIGGSVAQEE